MDEALGDAVAAAYRLGQIGACVRVDRVASSVARIETADRAYWLKLATRAYRTLDDLESEAEVASELAEQGLPVTPAVRRHDGHYAGLLPLPEGGVPALLFEEAPGVEVATPSLAQAEALGTLLARFHAARVRAAIRRTSIDADTLGGASLRAIAVSLHHGRSAAIRELALQYAALTDLAAEMTALAGTSLPLGLCHGDVQLENVRFDGASPTLLDLEACGTGPCAYDLACYWRKRIGLTDGEPPHAEWDALLRGYEQIRPLSPSEHAAIPALAALRAVWVMAMPAAPGTTWGQDWLRDPEYAQAHIAMIERLARVARRTA